MCAFETATRLYRSRMDDYLSQTTQPPTTYELRQQHQVFAFECLDEYRKSVADGRDQVWQVETALKALYEEYAANNRRQRQSTTTPPPPSFLFELQQDQNCTSPKMTPKVS